MVARKRAAPVVDNEYVPSSSGSESDSESEEYSETEVEDETDSEEEEEVKWKSRPDEEMGGEFDEDEEEEDEMDLDEEENILYSLPPKKRGQSKTSVSAVGKKRKQPMAEEVEDELDYPLPPKKRQSKASAETVGKVAAMPNQKFKQKSGEIREKKSGAIREKKQNQKSGAIPEKKQNQKSAAMPEQKSRKTVMKSQTSRPTNSKATAKKTVQKVLLSQKENEEEKPEYVIKEDTKSKVKDMSNSMAAFDRSKFLLDDRHYIQVGTVQIKNRGVSFDHLVLGRDARLGKDGEMGKPFKYTMPLKCTEPAYKAFCKITGRPIMDRNGNPMKDE